MESSMTQFFARINNRTVVEIISIPDEWSLAETFTPELVSTMVPCSDKIVQGQVLKKDGSFGPVPDIEGGE